MTDVELYHNNVGISSHVRPLPSVQTENFAKPHFLISKDVNMMKILSHAEIAIDDTIMDCMTSLHIAIESGNEEIVKYLLEYGARLNIKDLFGRTPLHLVAYSKFPDKMKVFRIAELILNRAQDVKALLNEYTDSGETVLHTAVVNNNEELIKLFLHYGANINAKNRDGKTPLYLAIEFSNTKVAELLLENGARVNDKMNHGLIALHEAIKQRAEKCVKLLVKNGAQVNAKDIYGKTPLHLAAKLNYLDERKMDKIVKLLLKTGADVNNFTNLGETAFQCAIVNGNEKLVRLFLDYGADVNIKNHEGKSPLHLAIQYSNKSTVKLLLDKGARIDDRTREGKMALHVAVDVEDEHIIKTLLEYNADVNVTDKSGKTPLSLAYEMVHMRSIYNPWNGFCTNRSENGCDNNIFEILIKHIAQLTNVSGENLKVISDDEKLRVFYRDCQAEIKVMKEHRICDNISMFRILTKNIRVILSYTRNENLLEIFESNLCSQTFPIYYGTLRERFYEAERRKRFLDRASTTFSWLIKPLSLPDIVTNEILSYLSIEDLIRLKVT